jgi:large subunit ribosomal protein L4
MQITVFDSTGKKLSPWSFDEKNLGALNKNLLAQALRVYLSNGHQGGSKVKTRGEVVGSTRKIYRQKGTGRARHGARYAPIFVGGGIAHGPTGMTAANMVLPKKMRRGALKSALLTKLSDSQLYGLEGSDKLTGKTSILANFLAKALGYPKSKVLIIVSDKLPSLYQALKNLQQVSLKNASLVNAHDLVSADSILLTRQALDALVARATNQLPKQSPKGQNV